MQPDRIVQVSFLLCPCFPFQELPHGSGLASAQVGSGEDADEDFVFTQSSSAADEAFDRTVGVLEEVAVSAEFQTLMAISSREVKWPP